jgi:hypothetical protein
MASYWFCILVFGGLQEITVNKILQLASHVAAREKSEMGQALLEVLISQYWAYLQ